MEDELWFLTLTLGAGTRSTAKGFSLLPNLWDTTRKNFQRFHGSFSYIAFVEGQPNRGYMPHFHILTKEPPAARRNKKGIITKRAIHDWAHSLGWGFQAELLIVSSAEAAAYVAKYASKQSPLTPKGFRRVRCSRSWPNPDKDRGGHWIVPAYGERLDHFVIRVADATALSPEDIYERWSVLTRSIIDNQLD